MIAFGAPEHEVRPRLQELLELAELEPQRGEGSGGVPGPLRRAVLELVGWRWEGFPGGTGELSAIVLFGSPRGIGLAHVGGTEPQVRVDGSPFHIPWSAVRDTDGREARVWFRPAAVCHRIELRWSPASGAAEVEAEWRNPSDLPRSISAPESRSAQGPVAQPTDVSPPAPKPPEGPSYASGRFFKWLDREVLVHRTESSPPPPAKSDPPTAIEPQASIEAAPEPRAAAPSPDPKGDVAGSPVAPPPALREVVPPTATTPPVGITPPPAASSPSRPGIAWQAVPSEPEAEPNAEPRAEHRAAAPMILDVPQGVVVEPPSGAPLDVPPGMVVEPPAAAPPDVPPGMVVEPPAAAPLDEPKIRVREPRRPSWPTEEELVPRVPAWRRLFTVILVLALFGGGWYLGKRHDSASDSVMGTPVLTQMLRAVGIGGARFDCLVTSTPPGAWISVDGKDVGRRTPSKLALRPGPHRIDLTMTDLGTASFTVQGERGGETTLNAPLWGSLSVRAQEGPVPILVKLDGEVRGYAPIEINRLAPGPHQVEFSRPGLPPWVQTIEVRVREAAGVNAWVPESPADGLIDVRATLSDGEDLPGATVWVDGERQGLTPLSLELPRGPHSIRAEYRGEEAPIQLIDLPGGNQRFATFVFGAETDRPRLRLLSPAGPMPRDRPSVVSAGLEGELGNELREMWLHVRTPEGPWRRYPMTVTTAPGGAVGSAVFPLAMVEASGRTPFYVSAITMLGDEYFTELQNQKRPQR